jgi:hypothetical protein
VIGVYEELQRLLNKADSMLNDTVEEGDNVLFGTPADNTHNNNPPETIAGNLIPSKMYKYFSPYFSKSIDGLKHR